jgi:hypothetical protein
LKHVLKIVIKDFNLRYKTFIIPQNISAERKNKAPEKALEIKDGSIKRR